MLIIQHTFIATLDKRDTLALRMFTMDFSKAFDNIKQDLLVNEQKRSPLNPFIINWYVRFLEGRKQRVVYNGITVPGENN